LTIDRRITPDVTLTNEVADLRGQSLTIDRRITPDVTLTNEGADQIVEGIAVPQAW
jgi:hypothetical protein